MDIAVVWNGKAGSATGIDPGSVRDRIAAATGREVTMLEVGTEVGHDPVSLARAAVRADANILVAAGGDGTVSACATELIGQRGALGVLPVGTSNSFAASLEIPDDLDAAIANLAKPHRRAVDAATVTRGTDKRVMILHCMVGLHAESVAETTTAAKKRWGVLAYAAMALKKLAAIEPFSVELATTSHIVRCKAIAIAAANLAPLRTVLAHGPSHILGDDGRIDVTIVAAETIAEAIATGVHLYRAGASHEAATRDNVGSFSTPYVELRAEPPQAVLVDGEPFGETPVIVETLPKALCVIAPPPSEAVGEPVEASLVGLPDLEVERR